MGAQKERALLANSYKKSPPPRESKAPSPAPTRKSMRRETVEPMLSPPIEETPKGPRPVASVSVVQPVRPPPPVDTQSVDSVDGLRNEMEELVDVYHGI